MIHSDLPHGWVYTTLGELAHINPKFDANQLGADSMVSFIPMKCVEEQTGRIDLAFTRKLSEVKKGYTAFQNGDILFAKITPCMENGKLAIVHDLKNGVGFGSTEFHVIRLPDDISKKLLFYFLLREDLRREARNRMTGSAGQLRVPASFIQDLELPLPPLPEQHRIVAKIEQLFSDLDAGVAALENAKQQLKRYRQSVLQSAVTGKLTATWRTAHQPELEPASVLLDRIRAERAAKQNGKQKPLPPLDTSELAELPEGWEWTNWETISPRVTVGFVGPMKHEYVEEGIPFLRSQNVRENRFDPDGLRFISPDFHRRISKSTLHPDDLVVVRSGSVGVTCVIPEYLDEANCADLVVIQKPLCFLPQFGAYYMNSLAKKFIRQGQVGVALIHFNTQSVAELSIPLPPLAEQAQIVAEVERRLSVADQIEKTIDASLLQSERLRQSILKKAFSGKLVPQDPTDEPAEQLLERILATRTINTSRPTQLPLPTTRPKKTRKTS